MAFGGRRFSYVVKQNSRARAVKITVSLTEGVRVTVPTGYEAEYINQVIRQKAPWIINQVEYLSELAGCAVPRSFVEGEQLFFLGNRYAIKLHIHDQAANVQLHENKIIVSVKAGLSPNKLAAAVRSALVDWYMKKAGLLVIQRVHYFSRLTGLQPAGVKVKEQKYRWGSCSSKGNLNFNWKLIMAPVHIIDYVVVHELCHLKRLDHSADFWRLVQSVIPDYPDRRAWLKKFGPALTL